MFRLVIGFLLFIAFWESLEQKEADYTIFTQGLSKSASNVTDLYDNEEIAPPDYFW